MLFSTLRPKQLCRQFADDIFKYIFNEDLLISLRISRDVCSLGVISQYSNIDEDNGLAPTRRQAIIWTNDDQFTDAYIFEWILYWCIDITFTTFIYSGM